MDKHDDQYLESFAQETAESVLPLFARMPKSTEYLRAKIAEAVKWAWISGYRKALLEFREQETKNGN